MKLILNLFSFFLICGSLSGASLASVLSPLVFESPISVKNEIQSENKKASAATRTQGNEIDGLGLCVEEKSASRLLRKEDVVLALQDALHRRYQLDGHLVLHFNTSFPVLTIEDKIWNLEIIDAPKNLSQQVFISFVIKEGEATLGPWRANLICEYWKEAYFPKERINVKGVLSSNCFDIKTINTLLYNQSIVPIDTQLDNYQLVQTLVNDRPLFWRDIAKKPTVNKGKIVNVLAQNGLLSLNMKAEILHSAFVGDYVTLRNLQTKKEFQGLVRDENTVEIYF